jgi:hypothetical protein
MDVNMKPVDEIAEEFDKDYFKSTPLQFVKNEYIAFFMLSAVQQIFATFDFCPT